MAYSPTYDRSKDSGTSATGTSDLNPESGYSLDLRNLDPKNDGLQGSQMLGVKLSRIVLKSL